MIFIIAYILFAILGITALSKGKVSLSSKSEITGTPARLIGVFALLTYPLAWIIGFSFGMYWGTYHPGEEIPLLAALTVNFGAILIVGIAIFIVAVNAPKQSSD